MTILSNKAQCLLCNDIVESRHRHDFRWCSCGSLAVDGGLAYLRRLYNSPEDYKELSEENEDDNNCV